MLINKIPKVKINFLNYLSSQSITRGLNTKKNYYSILNCSQNADASEIKKSFYALAKKYHPDVNKGNEEKFKEINEAYEVLGDPNTKKEYDAIRQAESAASSSRNSGGQGYGNPRQQQSYQGPFGSQHQNHYYQTNYSNTGKPNYQNQNFSEKMFQREEFLREFLKKSYEAQGKSFTDNDYGQGRHYNAGNNSSGYNPYQRTTRDQNDPNNPNNDAYQAYKMYQSKMQEELRREQEYERFRKLKEDEFKKEVEKKYKEMKGKYDTVVKGVSNLASSVQDTLKKFFK